MICKWNFNIKSQYIIIINKLCDFIYEEFFENKLNNEKILKSACDTKYRYNLFSIFTIYKELGIY